MGNVLIRDLPEAVHAELRRRAGARGLSLQQYLTEELSRLAEQPVMDEVLERIGRQKGGRVGFAEAVAALQAERGGR
jgi:plasmid stability protein